MFNRNLNDYHISSQNYSCLYGLNCNSPEHQNNNEKYTESNPQFYDNLNNNSNKINLKIEPDSAMRTIVDQKYIEDPFNQRIHYLKHNNLNLNKEFINSKKNNSMNYIETISKSYFNTDSSIQGRNIKKIKDVINYGFIPNTEIYNTVNNEENKYNKLTPNQILFQKNMESLKNMQFEKKQNNTNSPLKIYNNNLNKINPKTNSNNCSNYNSNNSTLRGRTTYNTNNSTYRFNNNNPNNSSYRNYTPSNNQENFNSVNIIEPLNNSKKKSKISCSFSNKISKNKSVKSNKPINRSNLINKKKNLPPNNFEKNSLKNQITPYSNIKNPKKVNQNLVKHSIKESNSLSKVPKEKNEERKDDNLDIKQFFEKEDKQNKDILNNNPENKSNNFETKYPKYKYISSLDEINKFSKDEQIKRLFYNNLNLYQELNNLRNENNILRTELKNNENKIGNSPNNDDDKFKNFLLIENDELKEKNRINEKILDNIIDKINEMIKEKNIEKGKNHNLISYNELFDKPDNTKIILDKILPSKNNNKILKNEQNITKNNFSNKSKDLSSFKNSTFNKNNINNNEDNLNILNNNINHKKSSSVNELEKNDQNKIEFYDYNHKINGKDNNKDCY